MASKPARVNITLERIRKLKVELETTEKAELMLWDSEQKGLGVRARKGREPNFIYAFRLDGNFRKLPLGACSEVTIEAARKLASEYAGQVQAGMDPSEKKKELAEARADRQAQTKREALTLGLAWSAYIETNKHRWSDHHLKDHQKAMMAPGQPRTRAKSDKTVAGVLWDLRNERLVDVPALIPDWARREGTKRPTTTKKAIRLLKTLLLEHNIVLKDAMGRAAEAKLRKALPKTIFKKVSLESSQLKEWWSGTLLLPPATSVYLRFQLLTGCRPSEGASLEWRNVDEKWHTLRVRDKVNKERVIPLTPYVIRMLTELKDYGQVVELKRKKRNYEPKSGEGLDYVFKAQTGGGHLTNADKGHNRVLVFAGISPEMNLHSLRKSFLSLWEQADLPSGAASQIVGHAPQSIGERHYVNRGMDRLRELMTHYEDWILEKGEVMAAEPAITNRSRRTLLKAVG